MTDDLARAFRSIAQLQARRMLGKLQRCIPYPNYCDKVATVLCQLPDDCEMPACDEHDTKVESRPIEDAKHIRQLLKFVEEDI